MRVPSKNYTEMALDECGVELARKSVSFQLCQVGQKRKTRIGVGEPGAARHTGSLHAHVGTNSRGGIWLIPRIHLCTPVKTRTAHSFLISRINVLRFFGTLRPKTPHGIMTQYRVRLIPRVSPFILDRSNMLLTRCSPTPSRTRYSLSWAS